LQYGGSAWPAALLTAKQRCLFQWRLIAKAGLGNRIIRQQSRLKGCLKPHASFIIQPIVGD
jgi:hypothetical protein